MAPQWSSEISRIPSLILFTVFYRVYCTLFYIENDAEIFPAHYTWKVAENEFKMAFMMNKDARLILVKLFLKKKSQNQVCTILVCTLYSIKYGMFCLETLFSFQFSKVEKNGAISLLWA